MEIIELILYVNSAGIGDLPFTISQATGFEVILPYLAAVGSVATGVAAVANATKGGGGGGSVIMPPSPKTTEPVIPRIDDAAVELQRKRTIAGQVAARGRAATVLTQPTGGFEAATGNKLGG